MLVYSTKWDDIRCNTYKKLEKKINQYDVISFDIFDTTLIRLVESPVEVFSVMENRENVGIDGFVSKRIKAQKSAYKTWGEKTNLEKIYVELQKINNIDSPLKEELIMTEVETERKLCVANQTVIDLMKYAKEHNKTVVFTSDMHLGKVHLMEVFDGKISHNLYDEIYCSCDYGCTKSSGRMFDILIKNYPERKILHIGDNVISDVLKTFGKKNIDFLMMPYICLNSLQKIIKYGISDKKTLSEKWVFKEFAPALWSFCEWVDKNAREHHCEELMFITREGAFLRELFDIYSSGYKTMTLFASRQSLLGASVDLNWEWIDRLWGEQKLQYLLNVFHINGSCKNKDKLVKHCGDLDEIRTAMEEHSRQQRKILIDYIKALGCNKGNLGFIDVGWKGSSQTFLKKILENEGIQITLHGFYIGVLKDEKYNIEKDGFVCSLTDEKYIKDICNSGFIFETVLSPQYGTTEEYEVRNGTTVPVTDLEDQRSQSVIAMQKSVVDFFGLMVSCKEAVKRIDREWALDRLFFHLNYPAYEMANELGDIAWKDFNQIRFVAKPRKISEYIKKPYLFIKDLHNCGWNSAFCLRLFKLPIPWFKIYSIIKGEGKK